MNVFPNFIIYIYNIYVQKRIIVVALKENFLEMLDQNSLYISSMGKLQC